MSYRPFSERLSLHRARHRSRHTNGVQCRAPRLGRRGIQCAMARGTNEADPHAYSAQCSVLQSGSRCMTQDRHNREGVPVGNGQRISPAEFLLMAGFLAYRAPLAPTAARAAACRILDAVLGIAAAHGFAHSVALESMMANGEKSSRMWRLAEQATTAVGDTAAYLQVIRDAGVTMEVDRQTRSSTNVRASRKVSMCAIRGALPSRPTHRYLSAGMNRSAKRTSLGIVSGCSRRRS